MKNHRRILISGIAVVCLLCIIIYLVLFCPITYKKTRVISDSDGQKKNVIFDVVLHREFGRVHKMNGQGLKASYGDTVDGNRLRTGPK